MKCVDWLADVSSDVQSIEHVLYQGLTIAEESVPLTLTKL
jgi:hypothetical protein